MRYSFLIFLIFIAGCKEGGMPQKHSLDERLDTISQAGWDSLAGKRIFFGHQSVGQNIISGLGEVMQSNPAIKLDIRETSRPEDFERPVFAHARIGENTNPKSKIDHFRRIMEGGVGQRADIAFFKLCYVDVDRTTDVEALFRYYDEAITRLAREFPELRIVTVTVPLMAGPAGIRAEIKRKLGRSLSVQDDNAARNVFNEMLRERYGASVFDLAGFESTMPDGERLPSRKATRHSTPSIRPSPTTEGISTRPDETSSRPVWCASWPTSAPNRSPRPDVTLEIFRSRRKSVSRLSAFS